MSSVDPLLVEKLALKAIQMVGNSSNELERCCWMVVHEYHHGIKPFEYDIREIDENLYLDVLKFIKENYSQ